ncbi:hypothetical protein [Allosphingosinicella vermicomposti]|uniref:hypothetical protein n=1 Tax=Allosphingosinicella vermicomposti TaxID=614671 RepID=UPI000D0FE9BC|nr:hypothetical protein [Allosphingosinicella vermicomposti]
MLTSNLKILLASAAVLTIAPPSFAQNQSEVVGPPALEDFDLKGEEIVTQPPVPAPRPQQQQQTVPVTVVPAPPAPSQSQPKQRPAQNRTDARREAAQPTPAQTAETTPAKADTPAAATPTMTPPSIPVLPEQSPAQADAARAPAITSDPDDSFPVWPAIAGGLVLLGAGFYFGRGRSTRVAASGGTAARAVAPPPQPPRPEPEPAPVAAAAAAATLAPRPRASIELLFEPTSTVLGDKEAIVHFLLTVHNDGKLPAKNVRLEARIFNASGKVDADIGRFFAAPLQRRVVSLPSELPPGERLAIQGEVPIPVADIKPVAIDGRSLFIPIVAVTAIYEWDEGSGQTSKSYMVGVEAQQTGKMGPFRLDQGPRVYRSVGQREHRMALNS